MALQLEFPAGKEDTARDVTLVHFTGFKVSLDEVVFQRIQHQLLALADKTGGSDLFLDFGNVEHLCCPALSALIGLHKKLVAEGRHLTIGNLSPQIYEVFAVTSLDRVLDLRFAGPEAETMTQEARCNSPTGILAVDDEPVVLAVLEARFRIEGYKPWLAGYGHQAIELYRRHREEIALVLLDVQMPGMDGPRTLIALQNLYPTVPCCFMTGNPTPYTEESLLRLGALRVFRKPFAFSEVIDTLNKLAGRPARRRQDRWIAIPRNGV